MIFLIGKLNIVTVNPRILIINHQGNGRDEEDQESNDDTSIVLQVGLTMCA